MCNADYFRKVYQSNQWGGKHSKSGPGSEGEFANDKIKVLDKVITDYGIKTLLDIGCGDFYWMQKTVNRLDCYLGIDVVPEMISENIGRYGSGKVRFECLDLSVPSNCDALKEQKWDLVVCFDLFGHLTNSEVSGMLESILFKLDMAYLLVTNRKDAQSLNYLHGEKTRLEGIDLEGHPLFLKKKPIKLLQKEALYPNDFYMLYRIR